MPALFLFARRTDQSRRTEIGQKLSWLLEAAFVGSLWGLCWALGPDRASALGYALLSRIGPRLRKTRHVRSNLALARPDASPEELDALVREAWGNTGAVMAEYPHIARIASDPSRTEIRGAEHVFRTLEAGRQGIFCLAHLGNWEVPAGLASYFGLKLSVVYSPMRNPWVARWMANMRAPLGHELMPIGLGMRGLVRRVREGMCLAMLADVRSDNGEDVPMFGQPVPTTLVPARLALRHDCDLFPVRVERLGGARFRVSIDPAIRPAPGIDDPREQALDMTAQLNDRFGSWIQQRPAQWLCAKRRTRKQLAPATTDAPAS